MLSLDTKLRAIGIQIRVVQEDKDILEWIDVEETLLEALLKCEKDRKLFGLICSWGTIYGDKIIAEKLIKKYKKILKESDRQIWINMFLIFLTENGDRRFNQFIKRFKKKIYPREYYKDSIKLKGIDPLYSKYNIFVPKDFIKISSKNILPPKLLSSKSKIIKNRYIIGPNWRADIISAIEFGFKNPYRISKTLGCSYDPAYRVFQEYFLVNG